MRLWAAVCLYKTAQIFTLPLAKGRDYVSMDFVYLELNFPFGSKLSKRGVLLCKLQSLWFILFCHHEVLENIVVLYDQTYNRRLIIQIADILKCVDGRDDLLESRI